MLLCSSPLGRVRVLADLSSVLWELGQTLSLDTFQSKPCAILYGLSMWVPSLARSALQFTDLTFWHSLNLVAVPLVGV